MRRLFVCGAVAGALPLVGVVGVAPATADCTGYRPVTCVFATTGQQTFMVPDGVNSIHVVAIGARGGQGAGTAAPGGFGDKVEGDVVTMPGATLYVDVGGNGGAGSAVSFYGGAGPGGFNGGAAGGPGGGLVSAGFGGGGGGGESDIRTVPNAVPGTAEWYDSLSSRKFIAGGGGGSGANGAGAGGNAGRAGSADGTSGGGGGGTLTTGGVGGLGGKESGNAGAFGAGGDGGRGGVCGGGGGGGGDFGGGGGGGGSCGGGGGGGGSSYTYQPTICSLIEPCFWKATNVSTTTDTAGTPSITISYMPVGLGPALTDVTQSTKVWHLGSALPQTAKARPPVGTTFGFTLDRPARIQFLFTYRTIGRRVGGRCVAQTNANRGRVRCLRTVRVAFSRQANAGRHQLQFEGRLDRQRKLPPGLHRLIIFATAHGHRSKPAILRFRILPATSRKSPASTGSLWRR